ncbi:MAG: hypothetical protein ACKPEN_01580 [Planktothrix sp.]|uniref:hypothetical protein n=1 Tax=Planktothrix sp. TaxID=3088171 RepID=UPI0038D3BEDD
MTAAIVTEPTNKREYYSLLTEKEATISKDCAERFLTGSRKASEGILEAGEALIKAKKELGHGKFLWFCQYELPVKCSQDTIHNFINTAKLIKQNPALAKFNPSIIFQLAKPSTPTEVVEEMKTLAETDQHQNVRFKDVQQKVKETKANTIKKGDIVEWSDVELKGYKYGRVVKIADGIVKLQTFSGMSIGERPVKFVSKCPIQKQNSNPSDNLEEGDLVTIKPYCSWLQEYQDQKAKVINVQPKKLLATVLLEDVELKTVLEFHWEEIEKIIEEQQLVDVIDVEATEITPENVVSNDAVTEAPLDIDLKKLDWGQKRQLLKELLKEMELVTYIPKAINNELDKLVEKTLSEMDDLDLSQQMREKFIIAFLDKCL